MTRWSAIPFGDTAVLVDVGWGGPGDGNETAQRFAATVRGLGVEHGFGEPVPAMGSVLVPFDPDRIAIEAAIARLASIDVLESAIPSDLGQERPPIELPVRYGGDDGPDLDAVARHAGLTPSDVIELHRSVDYRVLFLGFAPGFAYLGDLPERLSIPRLSTPRARVPAGSIGVAGRQTAVYPFASPGGWRLIGRTDADLWDVHRPSPALLVPGSRVRFVPLAAR
ncbi:MAG TPA: 5-oxoprolinase subunit PxpB [Candidatus Limnocylindrales bacterium]